MCGKWYGEREGGRFHGRRWRPMRSDVEQMVGTVLEQVVAGLNRAESSLRRAAPGPYAGMGPRSERSDDQIRADVEQAVTEDGWVDGRGIAVEVHEGVVTLRGTVPTSEQKRRAGEDAWDTPGVLDVQNTLAIGPGPQAAGPEMPEEPSSVD